MRLKWLDDARKNQKLRKYRTVFAILLVHGLQYEQMNMPPKSVENLSDSGLFYRKKVLPNGYARGNMESERDERTGGNENANEVLE